MINFTQGSYLQLFRKTISLLYFLLVIPGLCLTGQEVQLNNKAETIEDFETGDFSQFNWQFGGTSDWTISDSNPYEGTYSARSGIIGNGQSTQLSLSYEVYAADTLSFWYRVSSESNYDWLRFFIDGTEMDQWSGTIGWSKAEYYVQPGVHTFMWEYDKDFSVSTGEDACWIDYIVFPPEEIEAAFTVDTSVICQSDAVFFYDQSIGPVTEWNWTFEGGTPQTSTQQNPVVGYGSPGTFDVLLEVSDGVETSTLYMADFIEVSTVPQQGNTPTGISSLCATWGNTTYNTMALPFVSTYNWILTPTEAGTVSGNTTSVSVNWTIGYTGEVELKVAGINYCGTGSYSEPLVITRYLPEVTLTLPAYVGLPEPPFPLTGGTPEGGEYSGPGVTNGIFDPMAAGLGEHTITYTYTDVNLCTNSESKVITVTPNIGISQHSDDGGLSVYPNPNSGNFTISIPSGQSGLADIIIYNTLNEVVYESNNLDITHGYKTEIETGRLQEGIYFLRVSGDSYDSAVKVIIR